MKNQGVKKTALLLSFCFIFFAFTPLVSSANTELLHSGNRDATSEGTKEGDIKISSRIYELFFLKNTQTDEPQYLIPGGDVFGIRIKEEYPTVISAKDTSPIKKGDKIVSIDKRNVSTPEDVCDFVNESGGRVLKIEVLRDGNLVTLYATPTREGEEYKLGITLRKTASGIGTLTYVNPQDNSFGGLGHGVSDGEGAGLVSLASGEMCSVTLGSLARGEAGKPGELSGVLGKKHYGTITKNCDCGVFGTLEEFDLSSRNPIPVGRKSEIKCGEAEIISTIRNGKTMHYKIEITDVDTTADGSKCFKIKVTDPMLIAISGGIVRGMSGSPIIQNGKLVGAVTHVLVANPTEGYGIFIENMLNASQSQVIPKVA